MFSCIYVYFCTLLLVVFFFRGLGYEAEIFVRKEKKGEDGCKHEWTRCPRGRLDWEEDCRT